MAPDLGVCKAEKLHGMHVLTERQSLTLSPTWSQERTTFAY
jgi:hypothetical protein